MRAECSRWAPCMRASLRLTEHVHFEAALAQLGCQEEASRACAHYGHVAGGRRIYWGQGGCNAGLPLICFPRLQVHESALVVALADVLVQRHAVRRLWERRGD